MIKNLSACNAGDSGSIPRSGRSPGEGYGNPTPVFLPGKSYRGAWWDTVHGVAELDMTERLTVPLSLSKRATKEDEKTGDQNQIR